MVSNEIEHRYIFMGKLSVSFEWQNDYFIALNLKELDFIWTNLLISR